MGRHSFSWGIQADTKGAQTGGSRGQIPGRHSLKQEMPDHPLNPFPAISCLWDARLFLKQEGTDVQDRRVGHFPSDCGYSQEIPASLCSVIHFIL